MYNFLIKKQYIILNHHTVTLTNEGQCYFESLGINISTIQQQPGIFIKPCLDWTERAFHLGGNLAKAFFTFCENQQYFLFNKHNRAVTLTHTGQCFFDNFDKEKPHLF